MKTNADGIISRRRRLGKVVKSLESAFKVEMRRREVDDNPEVKLELDALAKKQRALDRLCCSFVLAAFHLCTCVKHV